MTYEQFRQLEADKAQAQKELLLLLQKANDEKIQAQQQTLLAQSEKQEAFNANTDLKLKIEAAKTAEADALSKLTSVIESERKLR